MNVVEQIALWVLAVSMSGCALLLMAAVRIARRRERSSETAPGSEPPELVHRSSVTVRCGACELPLRYENHPQGRDDAVALHTAYECTGQPVVRRSGR